MPTVYGMFATMPPREYRRIYARAWAEERKRMFVARTAILTTGDYQAAASSRMRLRAIERDYWNIRAHRLTCQHGE
jgi:hypothetical protein